MRPTSGSKVLLLVRWQKSGRLRRPAGDFYPHLWRAGASAFSAWWETYFRDEGFDSIYCHFGGLYALGQHGGSVVGMLGMDIPHLNRGHIVAVDELGVVDPAENAPDHVPLDHYVWNRKQDGVVFHTEWLAVRKSPDIAAGGSQPKAKVALEEESS